MLGTAGALDEDLLNEAVRIFCVVVVMSLRELANLGELLNLELLTRFSKSLERVLGLSREYDVGDEAQVVTLTRSVGEILCDAEGGSRRLLQRTADILKRRGLCVRVARDLPLKVL